MRVRWHSHSFFVHPPALLRHNPTSTYSVLYTTPYNIPYRFCCTPCVCIPPARQCTGDLPSHVRAIRLGVWRSEGNITELQQVVLGQRKQLWLCCIISGLRRAPAARLKRRCECPWAQVQQAQHRLLRCNVFEVHARPCRDGVLVRLAIEEQVVGGYSPVSTAPTGPAQAQSRAPLSREVWTSSS